MLAFAQVRRYSVVPVFATRLSFLLRETRALGSPLAWGTCDPPLGLACLRFSTKGPFSNRKTRCGTRGVCRMRRSERPLLAASHLWSLGPGILDKTQLHTHCVAELCPRSPLRVSSVVIGCSCSDVDRLCLVGTPPRPSPIVKLILLSTFS